jgi:death-on-curing family protein
MSEIIIYKTDDNHTEIEVVFENDTVWLNQYQLAELFQRDRTVITKHISNIFKEKELEEKSNVQKMHIPNSDKPISLYNLEVIISVGYRVKSQRGVQFRQWATHRLKDYLIKGYAINQKRLEENKAQFLKTIEDLKILSTNNDLLETNDVLSLIQSFSNTFFALDSYDRNEFPKNGSQEEVFASVAQFYKDLEDLKLELIKKGEASALFAQEKKQGNLEGIFGNVFQTVFGQDAYPFIEEKAAHLLYFIIKNHPFNDGNKRSAAFAFIWLLQKANYRFRDKISPETLTTLTILIAESNPAHKEKMIGIVQLLLNNR